MLQIDKKITGETFKSYKDTLRLLRLRRLKRLLNANQRRTQEQPQAARLRSKFFLFLNATDLLFLYTKIL